MKRMLVTASLGLLIGTVAIVNAQKPVTQMEVYKSPTCGCCAKWVEHVRQAGFTVQVKEMDDAALDAFKTKNGVPRTAQSCHTALIGGYVVEGHVPAAEISRMLKERPAVQGIAVGGMPAGSPGMEQGGRRDAYDVVLVLPDGRTTIYARYGR